MGVRLHGRRVRGWYALACMWWFSGGYAWAWEEAGAGVAADSVRELHRVTVEARSQSRRVAASVPVQAVAGSELRRLGVQGMADAVRRFAGATVKDYGGIGGLKTVSVRGLEAGHTAVAYDGLPVGNCQAGQVDIGRFSLDDVDMLSLAVGQQDELLQAARLYASAGVLAIRTRNPLEGKEEAFSGRAQLQGGSFGFVHPSFRWAHRIGERTTYTLSGDFLRADGCYPFTLVNVRQVSRERRRNSDIRSGHAEGNLYHTFTDGARLEAKAYYFKSQRGLPGSVVLYNDQHSERLWDEEAFVQASYAKAFTGGWRMQLLGKYNYAWNKYEDVNVKYAGGSQTDLNTQREYYLSATALWQPLDAFSLSWANDGTVNTLDSNLPLNPQPLRVTWISALHARWQWRGLRLDGTLVGTLATEHVESGERPEGLHRLSPTVSLSYRPWKTRELYVRLMYKETFRVPTFNELYYDRMGNRNLRSEKAREYNIGLTWGGHAQRVLEEWAVTADGYYNRVADKLVAMPSMYVWRMTNYGRVDIIGAETTARLRFGLGRGCALLLTGTYAFQRAVDCTDPDAKTYKHQIPYTPRHTGNIGLTAFTPWAEMGYSLVGVGERYSMRQNLPANRMEAYMEHTLSVGREFRLGACRLRLQAEVVNLTDESYEVIRYYPMPGRSYRGTVVVHF